MVRTLALTTSGIAVSLCLVGCRAASYQAATVAPAATRTAGTGVARRLNTVDRPVHVRGLSEPARLEPVDDEPDDLSRPHPDESILEPDDAPVFRRVPLEQPVEPRNREPTAYIRRSTAPDHDA